MADHSAIEWTEASWSPVTGCTKISAGCERCYIERTPPFRMNNRRFSLPVIGGTTGVQLHSDRLHIPLKWRKPRRIFVCSLADLFHEQVPDEFIARVFAVMSLAPQHTFQVLTKRHGRMRSLLTSHRWWTMFAAEMTELRGPGAPVAYGYDGDHPALPNVWLGVSVESQQWADIRIPALLETPAAVRWLSCEPLLGPVDLTYCSGVNAVERDWVGGPTGGSGAPHPLVDWVVAGAESGPGARQCDPDWIGSLVRQCQHAGTAVFVKQLGSVWARDNYVGGQPVYRSDPKGGDWTLWPEDLRIREYPADRAAVPA